VLEAPEIHFVKRGNVHLAYHVAGVGPPDIVFVGGSVSTTLAWREHASARGLRRLASFSRLITYDQRGMKASDSIDFAAVPTIDDLVADLEAVVAVRGIENPVLFGMHNGGAVAAVFASRHPVQQLILCNTWARIEYADDYRIGFTAQELDRLERRYEESWGEGRISKYWARPQPEIDHGWMELEATARNQAVILFQMNRDYDIRHVLPNIEVPTLVIHMKDNRMIPPSFGRYIAEKIPGAQLALVPGEDQIFLRNYSDEVIDLVELFVTGRQTPFVDHLTTTMLYTDIVDSTAKAASLGTERWLQLINLHNARVRDHIKECHGHEVKCTGDGFLVAFDETDAAVRCALAAVESIAGLGRDLEIRAGVHAGEVARMGSHDLAGVAVHFAQRLCDQAEGGQVLVSDDVRRACGGGGLRFEQRGVAQLKGIPGEWEVFEAIGVGRRRTATG
jgi:class 3 adenylate cyclase/pimeloyl-ACP methyl ester carboxylesterase